MPEKVEVVIYTVPGEKGLRARVGDEVIHDKGWSDSFMSVVPAIEERYAPETEIDVRWQKGDGTLGPVVFDRPRTVAHWSRALKLQGMKKAERDAFLETERAK